MDFLKILANLFQNGGQHPQAQQAAPNPANGNITAGPVGVPYSQQRHEDSMPVYTPNGMMPLSEVPGGANQPWQNPQNGYSPTGYNHAVDPTGLMQGVIKLRNSPKPANRTVGLPRF